MNRYIVASLLSHSLFIIALGLTSLNATRTFPVFDVNIVGPMEEVITPPAKTLPPPVAPVVPSKPPVKEIFKRPPDVKLKPETLYGNGELRSSEVKRSEPGVNQYAQSENDVLSPSEAEGKGILPPLKEKPSIIPPTALFDKKTIEKFALKEPPPNKGLTFDTSEFRHRGYMKMLKEKIESIWQYPKEAARYGMYGDLYVKFSIRKDGKLSEVVLLRTSGYQELDDAAIKALKDAEPYWPLPADWEKDTLEIKGHFIYIFGNTYVM